MVAMENEIDSIVGFLRGAERLKCVTRSGWTSDGERESVAAHSWRLCLLALVAHRHVPNVDFARLIKICLVHDLGEAIGGDIPAISQTAAGAKSAAERRDLLEVVAPLSREAAAEIVALWDEYEAAATTEAKVAKALDKLETMIQHNQGRNPPGFDYRFNLRYGAEYTGFDPFIAAFRARVDRDTSARAIAAERTAG